MIKQTYTAVRVEEQEGSLVVIERLDSGLTRANAIALALSRFDDAGIEGDADNSLETV